MFDYFTKKKILKDIEAVNKKNRELESKTEKQEEVIDYLKYKKSALEFEVVSLNRDCRQYYIGMMKFWRALSILVEKEILTDKEFKVLLDEADSWLRKEDDRYYTFCHFEKFDEELERGRKHYYIQQAKESLK